MDEILKSFLAGVGGAGVVILGLSAWVGKALASKISESDKSHHARDLEISTHLFVMVCSPQAWLSNSEVGYHFRR